MRSILTAIVLFAFTNLWAQGVRDSVITWNSSSLVEKHSNETVALEVQVKTVQSERIELHFPNQTIQFTIDSISGEWADPSSDGELVYTVKFDGTIAGTVTLKRETNATVEVDFTAANPLGMHQVFAISNYSIQ
jgi:hypothetical protein